LPEFQNEELQKILDKIKEAEKKAISEKKTVNFYFNLDDNSYWFEMENEEKVEFVNLNYLDFYKGKNEFEEKTSGIIYFKIYPDSRKTFLLLYIYDNEKNQSYTLFSNPFLNIEIYKGEIYEEEI